MIPLTLAEIHRVTGGQLHGTDAAAAARIVVDGPVVTDSREAGPGSLYVARIGEQADGHRYLPAAADLGAVAALTTRPTDGLAQIVVPDEQAAFVALARHLVDALPRMLVVGITGSSGKTSTKDLLGAVLATAGETVAPQGSYNSEVGVPLTVCRVTPRTEHLVVEMGARGRGHIAYLTEIAPPRIGVVLNVGHAHVGEFGSLDAVAEAKGELPEALPADGVAVLNADDPRVLAMAARTRAEVVLVGESPQAQVRAEQVTLDEGGRARFTLVTPQGSAPVALGLVGRHHVGNALAVVAVALAAGLPLEQVVAALAAARPESRWRMEVTTRADGVTIVNDAYNANPDSMAAALQGVAAMHATGRRWAVLGAMLELGPESRALHEQVGARAVTEGFDELLAVGELGEGIAAGAEAAQAAPAAQAAQNGQPAAGRSTRVRHLPDPEAAEAVLADELAPGDVVVFKSSRDAGLRWLGDRSSQMEVPS